jgi:hypothetical protein
MNYQAKLHQAILATPAQIEQHEKDVFDLETMIDRLGMAEIMLLITHICDEKAEHIRENWQDEEMAKRWDIVAEALISKRLSNALGNLS